MFGIQIWITRQVKGLTLFGTTIFYVVFLLIGVILPFLFYFVWGIQSTRVILCQKKPLNIRSLSDLLQGKILSLSILSLLIFIGTKAAAGRWDDLVIMLGYDIVYLVFFAPFVYFLAGIYFLFLHGRHPDIYKKLQGSCPTQEEVVELHWKTRGGEEAGPRL